METLIRAKTTRPVRGHGRVNIRPRASAEDGEVKVRAHWAQDSETRRLRLEEQRKVARQHSERLLDVMRKTLEEVDQIAREDVREVQKVLGGACPSTGAPPARKDDTGAKPLEEPAEPEFFRDPQRSSLAIRADVDASAERSKDL